MMTLQEFIIATDMTSSGTSVEKLRWAFKMYDEDGSGGFDVEMLKISSHFSILSIYCTISKIDIIRQH